MDLIYVVQEGGSDEMLLGIFATRQAAEAFVSRSHGNIWECRLNRETNEFTCEAYDAGATTALCAVRIGYMLEL